MTSSVEQREENRTSFCVAPPKALVSRVKVHRRRSLQTTSVRSPQEIANPTANAHPEHLDQYGYHERPLVVPRRMSLQPGGYRAAERRRSSISTTSVHSRRSSTSSKRPSVHHGTNRNNASSSKAAPSALRDRDRERDHSSSSLDDESWNFEDDELSVWD